MSKILIAAREEELAFLLDALGDEYETIPCISWGDAEAALDQSISLVICGAHFHDGRLVDFAKLAKSGAYTCDIPFYGIMVDDVDFSRHFIQHMRAVLDAIGAQGAFDLAGLRHDCGDIEAKAMLRTAVESIVMKSIRLPYVRLPRARALARYPGLSGQAIATRKHVEA
jgi:hypothetical protein